MQRQKQQPGKYRASRCPSASLSLAPMFQQARGYLGLQSLIFILQISHLTQVSLAANSISNFNPMGFEANCTSCVVAAVKTFTSPSGSSYFAGNVQNLQLEEIEDILGIDEIPFFKVEGGDISLVDSAKETIRGFDFRPGEQFKHFMVLTTGKLVYFGDTAVPVSRGHAVYALAKRGGGVEFYDPQTNAFELRSDARHFFIAELDPGKLDEETLQKFGIAKCSSS